MYTENHHARDCKCFTYQHIANDGDDQLKKRAAQLYLLHSQKQPDKYRKPLNHVSPPPKLSNSVNFTNQQDSNIDTEISQMTYKEIYSILHSSPPEDNDNIPTDDNNQPDEDAPNNSSQSSGSAICHKETATSTPAPGLASNFCNYLFNHS